MSTPNNINLLQPTAFKVIIDRKRYGVTEYYAQNVNHPNVSAQAAEVPFKRANIHMPADKLTFGPLSLTILLDEDLTSYTELLSWAKRLVEEPYKTRTFADSDEFPSTIDITVAILTSHNNIAKKIKYNDCVLTDLGDINFQATSGGLPAMTFTATFSFSYFEVL